MLRAPMKQWDLVSHLIQLLTLSLRELLKMLHQPQQQIYLKDVFITTPLIIISLFMMEVLGKNSLRIWMMLMMHLDQLKRKLPLMMQRTVLNTK